MAFAATALAATATAYGQDGPAAPRIAAVELAGAADPADRLHAYIETVAPKGSFFVEAGDADRVGNVRIGTVHRLRDALTVIGYDAAVAVSGAGDGGVRLVVHLRAYDRVRHIFV